MNKQNKLSEKLSKAQNKPRYYYFRLSYMSKQKAGTLVYADATVEDDSGSEYFPIMNAIKSAQEYFDAYGIVETIQVCNYMEIGKRDYEDFNEFRKSHKSNQELSK